MAVDLSGLPRLPDSENLRRSVEAMRRRAREVAENCGDARAEWSLIGDVIHAPGMQDQLVSALDVMGDFAAVVHTAVDGTADAVEVYADRLDEIRPRYRSVMADAQLCYAQPSTPEEAEAARQRDQEIQARINELVRQLQEWKRECADGIERMNGSRELSDPGWVATPEAGAGVTALDTLLGHVDISKTTREEISAVDRKSVV